jgi:hypothetical protein
MHDVARRFLSVYFGRHEGAADAEWLVREALQAEAMDSFVRKLLAAVPCREPHRSAVAALMRKATQARKKALGTPPSAELRIAMLEWHLNLAQAAATLQLPYSTQAMKGRRRVIAAGVKRRKQTPRNAAARMKRLGSSRHEVAEYLKEFEEIKERTRRNILAELYGTGTKKK